MLQLQQVGRLETSEPDVVDCAPVFAGPVSLPIDQNYAAS